MQTKTLCPLPWLHLSTEPNGKLRSCCVASENLTDEHRQELSLGSHSLANIWNGTSLREVRKKMLRGEALPMCNACTHEETLGKRSKRQWEWQKWETKLGQKQWEDIFRYSHANAGASPLEPIYLDLRLGNTCNLRCRMCNPLYSNALAAEAKLIVRDGLKLPANIQSQFPHAQTINQWLQSPELWENLRNLAPHLRELYLTGGEPFAIKESLEFLNTLVEMGHAPNISLRFSTNGTLAPAPLLNILPHFAATKIFVSLDGVGAVNDYIRYPSRWEKITSNIEKFITLSPQISTDISCTVMAYNIYRLPHLFEWLEEWNSSHGSSIRLSTNLLRAPSYLSIRILPDAFKQSIKKRFELLLNKEWHCGADSFTQDILGILQELENPLENSTQLQSRFIANTKLWDQYRSQKCQDVLPEIAQAFSICKNSFRENTTCEKSLSVSTETPELFSSKF